MNQVAYFIGLVFGVFGWHGWAHVLNGKMMAGVAWMAASVCLLVSYVFAAGVTGGLALLAIIPLHIGLAVSTARKGAANDAL